jgi:ATPase subunit of ABC transporter with duplicated ATPase domains
MVTHDRDFASAIATRVLAITEKKITDFHGTYEEYLIKHGKDYFKG